MRTFDNSVLEAVSASTRTAEVPSLALTTKVVPLVTSTIGGATIPELVPAPTENGTATGVGALTFIWYRFPFALPTINIPRTESRTGEVRGKVLLTTTGQGGPLRV